MTVGARRSENIKEAIPNILKTFIGRPIQKLYSVLGRGNIKLRFKDTFTYQSMRGNIIFVIILILNHFYFSSFTYLFNIPQTSF